MGTRSTVRFYSEFETEKPILVVYQQFDGYIDGVGKVLAAWLKGKTVINGIRTGQTMAGGFANGMGCLAAQYVAAHKTETGGFYIATSENYQQYNYHVRMVDKGFEIEVDDIFKGSPDELLTFNEHDEDEDE